MTTETYSFERYLNVRSAYGASFSADGKRLSFLSDITGVAEVWSVPVDVHTAQSAWPEQLTFRGERVATAEFSPVEDVLLLTADTGGSELTQLYTLRSDGSVLTALTNQPDIIYTSPVWSPDGKRIAYVSNERDRRFFDVYERELASGGIRCLLQHDGYNDVISYSPDGKQVLVNRSESNVRDWLLLVDTVTGETRMLTPEVSEGTAEHRFPAWSVDGQGKQGLYLLSNHGKQFLTLAWLNLETTEMTYLRENKWDSEALALSEDGTRMALVMNQNGYSKMELFDVSHGYRARKPLPGPMGALPSGVMRELTWSKDGKHLAFTLDSANDASDIWVWDVEEKALWRATHSATGGIPRGTFATPSLVHYPTFDERQIPAFLYLPETEQARNLPVVVYVHGGPEGQSRPLYNSVIQYLVSSGYAVLVPNVRGSTGYGYEYQSLDDVRLRMDSVRDLQYAARWLSERGIADPQ
ncbi:MAG TPA: prolyl oligopeptidase family serine peptidase, partial [Ktedonobacteraceae bacterium]|nr:prolyl oligopeptidase family serine peptidase [Ktedonobacteraceae bacterium]